MQAGDWSQVRVGECPQVPKRFEDRGALRRYGAGVYVRGEAWNAKTWNLSCEDVYTLTKVGALPLREYLNNSVVCTTEVKRM